MDILKFLLGIIVAGKRNLCIVEKLLPPLGNVVGMNFVPARNNGQPLNFSQCFKNHFRFQCIIDFPTSRFLVKNRSDGKVLCRFNLMLIHHF
jgi:hypothetical protein